jgi:hypothetical protein
MEYNNEKVQILDKLDQIGQECIMLIMSKLAPIYIIGPDWSKLGNKRKGVLRTGI